MDIDTNEQLIAFCQEALRIPSYSGQEQGVAELMKRLTGRNYPTFVDNMESVDDLANVRPTGQVIMAKCVSNAPLQVRPIKPVVCGEQQAA